MFSLWRKARRENSAASRLLGSTSLRFALHAWQRLISQLSVSGLLQQRRQRPGEVDFCHDKAGNLIAIFNGCIDMGFAILFFRTEVQ
ncbi:hypothetical protein [Thiolapillus sp.]|uniref:hypothetical protein n=1 Tax=Thiolapillus sp. TaxID=2017437 RepID=UPI003AF9C8D5